MPDGLIIVDDIYSGDGRNDLTLWNDGSIKQCLDGLNLKRITDDQYLEPYRVLGGVIYYHDYVSVGVADSLKIHFAAPRCRGTLVHRSTGASSGTRTNTL